MGCCVIIPTYQNLSTLGEILQQCDAANLPVIVVDDGSTDGSAELICNWIDQNKQRWSITMGKNGGKGAALAAGLAEAAKRDFAGAITVDADGQHRIADAIALLTNWTPGELLLGSRDETAKEYPTSSLFGRRLWSLGIRSLTGIGVSDPVCGLRVYPITETSTIKCRSGRYAWEEEFLVRAARLGVIINEQMISTVYLPRESRVSHYNLGRDWTESFLLYVVLAFESVVCFVPLRSKVQPLQRRDRSFRRLLGMAVFVGGFCGFIFPLWITAPILAWVSWKLHAVWMLSVASAVAVAFLSDRTSFSILAVGIVVTALAITQLARFLDKN
ncbi:MAG: glycosyltransferase family 2 protein [Planctomycetota bacterium]|nr:glycosyltransferase family 2 protein [Planctomycetota bacterium]